MARIAYKPVIAFLLLVLMLSLGLVACIEQGGQSGAEDSIAETASRGKGPANAPGNTISWSPGKLSVAVTVGTMASFDVGLVSKTQLEDVSIRVVPALAAYVRVQPEQIPILEADTHVSLTVQVDFTSVLEPIALDGVLQVRTRSTGNRVIAVPLPIELTGRLPDDDTPTNTPPIANAGPDQTAYVGDTVTLDGTGSTDIDGDVLSYHWRFLSTPMGNASELMNAGSVDPSFAIHVPGEYVIELVVNDGQADSEPDTVQVSTLNSAPVADAGPDQTVFVGTTVLLDGTGSSDVDNDPLNYLWSMVARPQGSNAELDNPFIADPSFYLDWPGEYRLSLTVNDGVLDSLPDEVVIATQNSRPVANAGEDIAAFVGNLVVLDGSGSLDADHDSLTYRWSLIHLPDGSTAVLQDTDTATPFFTPDAVGTYIAQLIVNDGHLDSDPDTSQVSVTIYSPPGNGDNGGDPGPGDDDGGSGEDPQDPPPPPGPLPPDPVQVAPPLPETTATVLSQAVEFLYTGSNPIQTGVEPDTIDARRVAVIRGRILNRAGEPLSGVQVTLLNHAELGQTLSRADGGYDLVVNGGGVLTISYRRDGYLPAQRQVNAPWRDYVAMDDLVMLQKDPVVTTVDFTGSAQVQVAQGSTQTDADGSRTVRVMIPQGTQAQIYNPDGTTQVVDTLNLRFTEYTVGPNGPAAMPAPLPPTSGYTYAFSLDADEAITKIAGKDVLFSQPVQVYAENFLGFPTGIQVPMAYYDYDKAAWIPTPDGRIIRIVSIEGGLADIDTTGDGVADNNPELGIDEAERRQLAGLYPVGQSLQRIPITHFSTYDPNYGTGCQPGMDCPPPDVKEPEGGSNDESQMRGCMAETSSSTVAGSIIECENQVLREVIPVVGTPYSLNYRSDAAGAFDNVLDIPLIGATVPDGLLGIDLEIRVAGRSISQSFPPDPNQNYTFTFDGHDGYGRKVQGAQQVSIHISYRYPGVYNLPPGLAASFGQNSGVPIPELIPTREDIRRTVTRSAMVGRIGDKGLGIGWSFAKHHSYSASSHTLWLGSGERYQQNYISSVIDTMSGTGNLGFSGDGGFATEANITSSFGVALSPDGSVIFSDYQNHRIRRVGPDGIITTISGTGNSGFSGDGGPATESDISWPDGVALGPDGSVIFSDSGNNRIRRVGPDGIITTIAGTGNSGFNGDGGLAIEADISWPYGVALGPDGSVIFSDPGNNRIRRVGPDGIITTIAGTGNWGFSGDGGLATEAVISWPDGVALGPDGSVIFADRGNNRIRRVGPDGIITTIVGTGNPGFSGDGSLATGADIDTPYVVALGTDGSVIFSDSGNNRIRRVGPDGIITTIAGTGNWGFTGDGGLATGADIGWPYGVAIGPDGGVIFSDSENVRIRRVSHPYPGFGYNEIYVASPNGSEYYQFDSSGRHLRTLDSLTGGTRHQFGYDTSGRVVSITDADGNTTTLERDAAGAVTAIVAPFGQRTELVVNTDNLLASVTNPAGEAYQMSYTADGQLAAFTDPRGNTSTMAYDDLGRLLVDVNAASGSQTLARINLDDGAYQVSRSTTLGRTTTHRIELPTIGGIRRTDTFPDGTVNTRLVAPNGSATTTNADGTVVSRTYGGDPRFQMMAPVIASQTTTTGALTQEITRQRTANLSDKNDPLSLIDLTELVSVNGRTSSSVYDAATRSTTVTTAAGRTSTSVMDVAGRPIHVAVPGLFATESLYDSHGRLSNITQGSGGDSRQINLSYNEQGYLGSITDPLSRTRSYEYDAAGRVTTEILPGARQVQYTYDANGNLTSVQPPGRPAHGFVYNEINLVTEYIPPDVSAGTNSTIYTYDGDKALTGIARPDGKTLAYRYDSAGRLDQLTTPDGVATYAYSPTTGKLTGITTPGGITLEFIYSGALQTQSAWSGEISGSVGYAYDNDFRIRELTLNGAQPIGFGYEADGLLISAGALNLTWFSQNSLLSGSELSAISDSYSYNGFGEVVEYAARKDASSLLDIRYTYDALGRIVQKTETIEGTESVHSYGYDAAGRLSSVTSGGVTTTYAYDGNGNRTHVNGVVVAHYDGQDRMISYAGADYIYTDHGELSSKTVSGETTNYEYDVQGNLRRVVLPDGNEIEYVVDGRNRRIGKRVNGALVQGFLYQDQLKPIAELDENKNVISRFIYATRMNVPDYMIKDGVTYRIISDHLGSPRLIVNAIDGVIAQRMDYDELGNVLLDTNPGFQPFGFAGGIYDIDTTLYRFGARDYDPYAARWTSKDPILFKGGDFNLYAYVLNNPINFIDLTGLEWQYSQLTGQLTHVDGNGTTTIVGGGYSGNGPGLNNPAMQDVPYVGPIPQGVYDIGQQRNSPNTGPGVLPLTPQPGTNTYGRDNFQIHGDNRQGNQSASQGCMIFNRNTRDQINNSGDNQLRVVP